MATIQSTLSLSDKMSPAFSAINKAMNSTLKAIGTIKGAALGPEFAQAAGDIKLAEDAIERLNADLNRTDDAANDASGSFTIMKGTLSNLVADGIRRAISATKEFAAEMITTAATVKAEASMFEQTFGGMGDEASAAIMRVADAGGIMETRLNVAGARVYSFAKSSGATASEAMSLMETALMASADSAAYYDKSLEETTDTLMSFLKGNYANDAALGVSATEFTRNAKATALFGKEYNNLTEIQKQQTLLKMVTDSQALSGAMGQAARESDGFENVMGNLNESWRQFQAQVGAPFLEALIPILQQVTDGVIALRDNWSTIGPILGSIAAAVAIVAAGYAIWTAITWLQVAANQALIVSLLTNPIVLIVAVIAAVIYKIYEWVQAVGGIKIAWAIVVDKVLYAWDSLKVGFTAGVYIVQNLWDKLGLTLAKVGVIIAGLMGDMKVNVLTILQNMVNGAIDIINGFIETINKIPGVNLDVIEKVTFATTAAAENEAAKQARAAGIAQMETDVAARAGERDTALYMMAYEARAEHQERLANIATMQAEKTAAASEDMADTLGDVITGSGSGAAVKTTGEVEISGEDIKMLLDIATQDQIITYQTLTPQIVLTGTTIRETADVNQVIDTLAAWVEETTDASLVIG